MSSFDQNIVFVKLISLSIPFMILINAYISRAIAGFWLNPGAILSLFLFLYTLVPLLVGFFVPVSIFALLYIYAFSFVFVVSSIPFCWRHAAGMNDLKPCAESVFAKKRLYIIFLFVSLASIFLIVLGMFQQGFNLFDGRSLFQLAGSYAAKRYSGEMQSNVFSRAGLVFCYPAAVLGGFVLGVRRRGGTRGVVLLLSFAPSLFIMVFQSAKGMFFLSGAFFLGSLLVVKIYNKDLTVFHLSDLLTFSKYSLVATFFITISFLSRGIYMLDLESAVQKLLRYFVSYSSGHLYAFSDWFVDRYFGDAIFTYMQESLTLGFYTFMSVFRLFGDDRYVPHGVYEEFFSFGPFLKSNIYTAFRGLIFDYGLVGSLIFVFMIGLIVHFCFYHLLKGKLNPFLICFFVFFVGFVYQIYIISTLTWLVIPASFLVSVFLIFFSVVSFDWIKYE